MPSYTYIHIRYTNLYNSSVSSCYSSTAACKDCYSELTAYKALTYSYWASFHNAYPWQGYDHQLRTVAYNDYSCHITAVKLN